MKKCVSVRSLLVEVETGQASEESEEIMDNPHDSESVSFLRPRHRLLAVASLGRHPRNRSIRVWFTRYPRTALHMTAMAGSDVVQSGRPIFDDFFQHLWPYIGNNTANVFFLMVKRLWLIRIDQ
ncbi:hypothetical protein TNCV_4050311 [Trichonephila clavipes]|nr:hypothetical protein TNCV_4050311 [Trichonephila clavipes]